MVGEVVSASLILGISACVAYVSNITIHKFSKTQWNLAYHNSLYLSQFCFLLSLVIFSVLFCVSFTLAGIYHLNYVILCCLGLYFNYKISIHSLLVAFHEKKFRDFLTRLGASSMYINLENALINSSYQSKVYSVAVYTRGRLEKAKFATLPADISLLAFLFIACLYIPLQCVKGIFFGSLLGLSFSILPGVTSIVLFGTEKQFEYRHLQMIRCSPIVSFLLAFFLTTPYIIENFVRNSSPELMWSYI